MKNVKFAIFTFIVMIIEFDISYLVAIKFDLQLINAIFSVGLFFIIITFYFSGTGGLFTNYNDAKTTRSLPGLVSNYKSKRTFGSLSVNCFNLGSLLFFLIGMVVAFSL